MAEKRIKTIYVTWGNSDNRLSQRAWANFCNEMQTQVKGAGFYCQVFGEWFSLPNSTWQNACIAFEAPFRLDKRELLKRRLLEVAAKYNQHSIVWAEAKPTFLYSFPIKNF